MNIRGQTLLIAVFIMLFLLLSVPVLVFINRIGGIHQIGSQHRTRADTVAQEGIAYGMKLISNNWNSALAGTFPAACNSGVPVQGSNGSSFLLTCATMAQDTRLRPYQIKIKAAAILSDGVNYRDAEAFISPKTLAARTGDGSVTTAAALALTSVPNVQTGGGITAPLVVHWGPVVLQSTYTWTLVGVSSTTGMESIDPDDVSGVSYPGFPRKFSLGGITGTTFPRIQFSTQPYATDEKEYWGFSTLETPQLIDETYYIGRATSTLIDLTGYATGITTCAECDGTKAPLCGCINASPGNPVTFPSGYSNPSPNDVFYIKTNDAVLNDAKMDMRNGAFIVAQGTLTLNSSGSTSGLNPSTAYSLWVASSAPSEYAYWPSTATAQWPCSDKVNTTCPSSTPNLFPTSNRINIWGFVYSGNGLIVVGPNWNILGGMLVGDLANGTGLLTINPGGRLTLVYDDIVVHTVRTQQPAFKIDFQQYLSP